MIKFFFKRRLNRISFKVLWPLFPAIFLVIITLLLGQLKIFNIKNITCSLDSHPCSLDFEPFLVTLVSQNIFKLKKSQVIDQLLEVDHNLININIDKTLPHSLTINMNRRLAIAKVYLSEDLNFIGLNSTESATLSGSVSNTLYFLDKFGEIYQPPNFFGEKLPKIIIKSSKKLDSGVTSTGKFLVNLIQILNNYYINFEELALIPPNTVILKTSLGPFSIFDQTKSSTIQGASLQFILSNIKIGERLPNKIDLRFDKPILTY